jgi:uncharacterized membrane protein
MSGIAIAAGLGLGVLVVILLEFMDGRLHSEREIKKILPVAVISEIPEMLSPSDVRRDRRRLVFGWALAAVVIFVMLAGSAVSYLHA